MVPAIRAFLFGNNAMPKKLKDGRWRGQVCWTDHINHPDRPKRQKRLTFETRNEAAAWEQSFTSQVHIAEQPLTDNEVREYLRATALLPEGMTLVDAVLLAREVHKKQIRNRATVTEAATLYIKEKSVALKRESSLWDIRQKINRLSSALGTEYVDSVTPSMLVGLLADMGVSGSTRNNYRKHWKMFFAWCVHAGYSTTSPANAITRTATTEKTPPIFTSEQVKHLFDTIHANPKIQCLAHYEALAFLAGIRPTELRRIEYKSINLATGKIHITPDVAKTRSQGYIDIHPVLAQLLKGCPNSGLVWPQSYSTLKRRHNTMLELTGLDWSPDVARHSYASHLLAKKQNAAYVRFQLRQDSDEVLFRHYIAVVTTADAKTYFDPAFYV